MTLAGPTPRSRAIAGTAPAGLRSRVAGYLALAKPRVIELLLVTTIPAMFLAGRQFPDPLLVLFTLLGGTMAAGSANAMNCVIDADIDKLMHRTKRRPLVRDAVSRRGAAVFGVVLGVASFALLYVTVNLLAAVLAIATILFYIFVYTLLLK
ncbi:MAG: UbiA family prenyltransferase, partial [Thermocrispum sp.]